MRACSVCGQGEYLSLVGSLTRQGFSCEEYDLVECTSCDHIFLSPLPTAADLQRMYGKMERLFRTRPYREPAQAKVIHEFLAGKFKRIAQLRETAVSEPVRVLEVGAGFAWMCRVAKQFCADSFVVAQDVFDQVPQGTDRVDRYYLGDVKDAEVSQYAPFEVISLTHVFEHLIDPRRELAYLRTVLAPNGVIFITAPHRPPDWEQDRSIEAWKRYPLTHVPAHVNYFSQRSLGRLADQTGLQLHLWRASKQNGALEAWLVRPHSLPTPSPTVA